MGFKLPPVTVLPGGRKVRDYSSLEVTAVVEVEPEPEEEEPEEEKPKAKQPKADSSEGAAYKDESLG